jgi:surface protein
LRGKATRIAFGGLASTTPKLVVDVLTNMSDGLTGINSGKEMFRGCTSVTTFTEPAFFDDVSGNVTTMESMFEGATNFNGNISGWDTSSVTSMKFMFVRANSFNQPIGGWNVSSVTGMHYMFLGAFAFNQPLNSWDTSKVTNMYNMFYGASSFNQDLDE